MHEIDWQATWNGISAPVIGIILAIAYWIRSKAQINEAKAAKIHAEAAALVGQQNAAKLSNVDKKADIAAEESSKAKEAAESMKDDLAANTLATKEVAQKLEEMVKAKIKEVG